MRGFVRYTSAMLVFAFGVFGLIVGSFLNVIILRHGVRSIGGRSGCMSCGAQLSWYDMVPLFSWLTLRGRCRFCRARISIQYPLVEAATGTAFALLGCWVSAGTSAPSASEITLIALYLCIAALLVCIAAYDILHTIIPDEWSYLFAGLAFVSGFFAPFSAGLSAWEFILAGPISAAPLFGLWLFSRGAWMGLGDAKLALGIGWLLGPVPGLLAVFGAFVIGAVASLILVFFSSGVWKGFTRTLIVSLSLFFERLFRYASRFFGVDTDTLIPRIDEKTKTLLVFGFTMKSEIPFGPFLIFSCIIIWFASLYGIDSLRVFGLLL